MAKNDYFVIVYYILNYLYECLKASVEPNEDILLLKAYPVKIEDEYTRYIYEHLARDGLIEKLSVHDFPGLNGTLTIVCMENLTRVKVTPKGIEYLMANSMMSKAREMVKDFSGLLPW